MFGMMAAGTRHVNAAGPTTAFYNTLLLNGSSQYVTCPDSIISGGADFSIRIRFKIGSDISTTQYILGLFATDNSDSSMLRLEIGLDTLYLGYQSSTGTVYPYSETAVINTWYDIIVTHDFSAKRFEFYLDGVSVAGATYTGTLDTATRTTLGARNPTGSFISHLEGALTLTQFFDTVITGADITELQTLKQPNSYSAAITSNYVLALPLNDGVVDPYIDRSADGNDGTAIGSPTFTGEQLEFAL